jgi:hypothetical protein
MFLERIIQPVDGCSMFLGFRTYLEDGGHQNGDIPVPHRHDS